MKAATSTGSSRGDGRPARGASGSLAWRRGSSSDHALRGVLTTGRSALPRSRLVVLENSHNLSGGTVLDAAYSAEVRKFATENGLAVHLDGARLANAAVALGVSLSDLAASADSVSFCLSKGLGAPIGTMLSGSAEFVRQARRVRKLLGGGCGKSECWRRRGLLAIAEGVARLGEDHAGPAVVPPPSEPFEGFVSPTPSPIWCWCTSIPIW
jgi:threonine aldolase